VPRDVAESGYSDEETDRLQLIWGDGFLSPGGSAEVARILEGAPTCVAVTFQGVTAKRGFSVRVR